MAGTARAEIGILGGTGLYDMPGLEVEDDVVRPPYAVGWRSKSQPKENVNRPR